MITTDKKYNFTKAENETFSWDSFSPSFIIHKPSGKKIYQMDWYEWKNSKPITDQSIKDSVTAFRAEMKELRDSPSKQVELPAEEHGNGWCEKCQSYCYGDCEA